MMNDLAVSDRRIREKISPFYVPISSNYFTKNGKYNKLITSYTITLHHRPIAHHIHHTLYHNNYVYAIGNNLGDFNKIQVIKKADAALDVIHQEEDKEGAMSEGAMSEGQDRRERGEGSRKGNKTKKGISVTSMALLRLFHTFKTELGVYMCMDVYIYYCICQSIIFIFMIYICCCAQHDCIVKFLKGGEEKLEEIGNEFVDYAEKIRERRTKPIFDVGLDFADACLKGKSFQVSARGGGVCDMKKRSIAVNCILFLILIDFLLVCTTLRWYHNHGMVWYGIQLQLYLGDSHAAVWCGPE